MRKKKNTVFILVAFLCLGNTVTFEHLTGSKSAVYTSENQLMADITQPPQHILEATEQAVCQLPSYHNLSFNVMC